MSRPQHRRQALPGLRLPALFLSLLCLLTAPPLRAGEVLAAVAANFTAPMRELARRFEAASGHRVTVSFGSTGKLYAQIRYGAPYDVFLAADRERPARLWKAGRSRAPFTYAVGRLVLWSPDPDLIDGSADILAAGSLSRLAITNPRTAPYGAAAMQVLETLGLKETLSAHLVRGDNTAQTYQFVMSGNVKLGFVALSQVVTDNSGSRWQPPQSAYDRLRQDAVLLDRGRDNAAAEEFLDFLRSEPAQAAIQRFGYSLERQSPG